MATSNTKENETTEEATPDVEAPVVPMSATDELAQLEKDFKAKQKVLKAKAKTETKSAAIDLVQDVADRIREELVIAVGARGLRLNSFSIRYAHKDGETQVSPVVGVVRMGASEGELFRKDYADELAALAADADEDSDGDVDSDGDSDV